MGTKLPSGFLWRRRLGSFCNPEMSGGFFSLLKNKFRLSAIAVPYGMIGVSVCGDTDRGGGVERRRENKNRAVVCVSTCLGTRTKTTVGKKVFCNTCTYVPYVVQEEEERIKPNCGLCLHLSWDTNQNHGG
jgi:hypothetical protein